MGLVQNNIEESIEQYNNSLILELGELHDNLIGHAESINRLFYYYIQNCVHKQENILMDQSDIYSVLEVVEFLKKLKYKSELSTNE